jgi:hypothetical protein
MAAGPLLFGQEMLVGVNQGDGIDRFGDASSEFRHDSPPGGAPVRVLYHSSHRGDDEDDLGR